MSMKNIHSKYLYSETNFLIEILKENGHKRNAWIHLATEYLRDITKPKSKDQDNTNNNKSNITMGAKSWSWTHKNRKVKYIKTVFKFRPNLKSTLCQNNSKLLLNYYQGG